MARLFTRSEFLYSSLLATISFTTPLSAFAQQRKSETDWTALTDDVSRTELFKTEIIPAALREEAADSAVTLAIPPVFYFPDDARVDRIENKPRQNSIFGIDISHHLSKDIDFALLRLQRVGFIYCKATQGVGYKDPKFARFWKALGALKEADRVYRGAYHFLSADKPGRAQADSFVDYLELQGGLKNDDLPPVIDLEWDKGSGNPDRWRDRGSSYILDQVSGCLDRVKTRTKRTPLIYTAKSWFGAKTVPLSEFSKLSDYPIWIADYNNKRKLSEKPDVPSGVAPVMWQFSDKALLASGYDGGLDANIFYGTMDDFKKKLGMS